MVIVSHAMGTSSSRVRAPAGAATAAPALRVDVSKLSTILWVATSVILGLGILREFVVQSIGTGTMLKDLRHFALDAEHSLPVWYEATLMAAAAGLLAVSAALSHRHDPRNRLCWALLAAIFVLMSIDEAAAFHEVVMAPLRDAFHLTGLLHFSWVVVAAPLLVLLAIFYLPFLFRLPRRTAVRFATAGTVFVAGAFGLEFVGGYYVSIGGFEHPLYKIAAVSEECLETVGMTLFVTALLDHLVETSPSLQIALRR
jgi:hypothetical protein